MIRSAAAPAALTLAAAAAAAAAAPATAGGAAPADPRLAVVERLAAPDATTRKRAAAELLAAPDPTLLPPLVDQLFFTPPASRDEILRVLRGLSGSVTASRYLDWVEHVSGRDDLAAPAGYLGWKGRLFGRIDPVFAELLREGTPLRLRPWEVVPGGVRFDGIPALRRPPHVPAAAASHLHPDELVFGARLGGAARAWPLRVLSWHEMLDDELGGEPVTLSYCTLCRSAVLYRGRLPDGTPTSFGTSGLLYRSNKLMFDRATRTLWSNLTGEPLLGPLAARAEPLEALPLTTTTWEAWRRANPDTTAMVADDELARRYGFDYRPGAADSRRAGVAFPVPRRDRRLADREEVLGVALAGHATAYPLAGLLATGVLEDLVGGREVVLVADPETGAIRAYAAPPGASAAGETAGRHGLSATAAGDLRDAAGRAWHAGEEALAPTGGEGPVLPRIPAHRSFWFGWSAFYPHSQVWSAPGEP